MLGAQLVHLGGQNGRVFLLGQADLPCHPPHDPARSGPVRNNQDLREDIPWLFYLEPNIASCNFLPGFSHCLCQGPWAWHRPRNKRPRVFVCLHVSVFVCVCNECVYVSVHTCVWLCECVRAHICACVYVSMCVGTCISHVRVC